MRPFIDDYIKSLSTSSKIKAAYVLQSGRVDKNEVKRIADRLSKDVVLAGLSISDEKPSSLINATKVKRAFSDAEEIFRTTYDISNEVSLLLESHGAILSSDLKSLEDELIVLEKAVDNYAFLLSDAKAFNYAYMEAFNDDRGRDYLNFPVPDRAGLSFTPLEEAVVDPQEGVLSIGRSANQNYPLTAHLLRCNAAQYIRSDTGIDKSVTSKATQGWKVSVASPGIITSGIGLSEFSEHTNGGLQILAEYSLMQPSPVDTISIRPMARSQIEVLQIRVYLDEEEQDWFDLIDPTTPEIVRSLRRFSFNLQSIFKFKLLFRKVNYSRGKPKPTGSEWQYRKVFTENTNKTNRVTDLEKVGNKSTAQRDVFYFDNLFDESVKTNSVFKSNLPRYESSSSGALAKSRYSLEKKTLVDPRSTWNNDSVSRQTIYALMNKMSLGDSIQSMYQVSHGITTGKSNTMPTFNRMPPRPPQKPGLDHTDPESYQSQTYDYDIGLMNVSAFSSVNSYRAVFVSRQIPSNGDAGAVRLKSSEVNFFQSSTAAFDPGRDNNQLTSVEYSVTNKASPQLETDWTPILPIGTEGVVSERLYPSATGEAFLRFLATVAAPITLYKNGFKYDNYTPLLQTENQVIKGLKMAVNSYSSDDILTVDYIPLGDPTTVDFQGESFEIPPLVSASDDDGAGQGFSPTGGQVTVRLNKAVFIDYSQVNTSTYNTAFGMTPYSPIVVRLDDGSLAYNLTNYRREAQSTLDPSADVYQYLHSGDTLIFNKPVTEAFRVFYQCLPENLRVRTVLRVNNKDWVTPKVDYFQIKAKVRSQDPKAS